MSSRFSPHRRRFLFTAGAALGLPWLESLINPRPLSRAIAQAPDPALRLFAYYVPCGIHMAKWAPPTQGPLQELSPILAPLNEQGGVDLRPHVEVLTGLRNDPAKPDGPGDHAAGTGGFLTCTTVRRSETDIRASISMDQVYANHLKGATYLPSLQLGTDGGANSGVCDSGFGCVYSRNISWAGPTQPLPKLTEPHVAFDLLFAGHDGVMTKAQVQERKARRLSVLDAVLDQANHLSSRLSKKDQAKLSEYMGGVRDLELRIEKGTQLSCDKSSWVADYASYEERVDVLLDLCVLAMQCDATRVISFMHGNAGSGRSHPFLGIPESHHDLSHHGNVQATFDKLVTINTWEVKKLARLLTKMAQVQEGQNTLLDNSLVFFSSEISDGNRHNHDDLPVLLAGHAGQKLQGGRHRVFQDARISELFISMLDLLGFQATSFGDDGKGPLSGF